MMGGEKREFPIQKADGILGIVFIILEKFRKLMTALTALIIFLHMLFGVIKFDIIGSNAIFIAFFFCIKLKDYFRSDHQWS